MELCYYSFGVGLGIVMGNICDIKARRVRDLLQWAVDELRRRGFETPRLDAEVLLAHVMKTDRLQLYLNMEV